MSDKSHPEVFVLLADGFEEIEALTPVDYLKRAGASVTMVSITDSLTVVGAHRISVLADISLKTFSKSFTLPDAIYIPGGMPGAKNISTNNDAVGFISTMFQANRLIVAICASPVVVLAKIGVLKGKKFTCYGDMVNEIPKWAGPLCKELTASSTKVDAHVVHDGNLITGNAPGAAEELSLELIKTLFDDETAKNIVKSSFLRNPRTIG